MTERIDRLVFSRGCQERREWADRKPIVATAVRLMARNVEYPLSIRQIAARCRLSQRHMQRIFRSSLATSPKEIYLGIRLEFGRRLLATGACSITDVAMKSGFSSSSQFSHSFRKRYGASPSCYRTQRSICRWPEDQPDPWNWVLGCAETRFAVTVDDK